MSDREQGAMADWLAGLDDGLCERWTRCTLCGRQPVTRWGICGVQGLAVAYVLCPACWAQGGAGVVERLLEARYGTTRQAG